MLDSEVAMKLLDVAMRTREPVKKILGFGLVSAD